MTEDAPDAGEAERRYLPIEMPAEFILEFRSDDGQWLDHGMYAAEQFVRLDDGAYLCSGYGGSPTFLRCVEHHGDWFEVTYPDASIAAARLEPLAGSTRYQLRSPPTQP